MSQTQRMSDDNLTERASARIVALCGGVGGAKLALGLDTVLGKGNLTVVVNTGDDFEHLGLHVSPDLDTVLYTLAGISDAARGWGRANESWNFMAALGELGGDSWFNLGDRDLALHVERTHRLRAGQTLGSVTEHLAQRLQLATRILPVTNAPVRTMVHTPEGALPFQEYFVKHRCEPMVTRISFVGAEESAPNPAVLEALAAMNLAAIVICPSNPYLSIDPILAVPGMRAALNQATVPVIAVSPIIGGRAIKGPTAKIMTELGVAISSQSIVDHYRGLIDGLVIDQVDVADGDTLDIPFALCDTLMRNDEDKQRLAKSVLSFADRLSRQSRSTQFADGSTS